MSSAATPRWHWIRCRLRNYSFSNAIPNYNEYISNMTTLVLKDESYKLMGLLFEVHNKLGPIYKEINYQDAIEALLKRENIPYIREKKIAVRIGEIQISALYADFVIDGKILIEVKAKRFINHEDIRQTSRMIKSENIPLAIIVNFKRKSLEYKRIINPVFGKNS